MTERMGDGLRTIRTITRDDSKRTSRIGASSCGLRLAEGWELHHTMNVEGLLDPEPADARRRDLDRRPAARRERLRVVSTADGNDPVSDLRRDARLEDSLGTDRPLLRRDRLADDSAGREDPARGTRRERRHRAAQSALGGIVAERAADDRLPERLLRDLTGEPNQTLIAVLTDPETSLFNYEFLCYKLDEEFKRAVRFETPLSCVMLGFEGQADQENLSALAGIFLQASRDTDILGRFDETSFLFLLPNTGPDGAAVMSARIQELANDQGLSDLVGDPLHFSVGISSFPDPSIERREDLYGRAREAFLSAQREGGGVVHAV